MIGVAQDDLRTNVLDKVTLRNSFDRTCRANWHEYGGLNRPMIGLHNTGPSFGL
jgi:hypothetical protein